MWWQVSSIEEFFLDIKSWLSPNRATYGNPRNSYSNMYSPVLYDYIWHKAAGTVQGSGETWSEIDTHLHFQCIDDLSVAETIFIHRNSHKPNKYSRH